MYLYEKNIHKDFIKFIDCYQYNYGQSSINVESKITGEIIGKRKTVINIQENGYMQKYNDRWRICDGI